MKKEKPGYQSPPEYKSEIEEKALSQALEYLDKLSIKLEGLFSREDFATEEEYNNYLEEVKKDLEHISKVEKIIREKEENNPDAKNSRELSQIMEAILISQTESANWFGEKAMSIVPSRYDDIVNGIDGIIEFPGYDDEKSDHLALGIDVTYGRYTTITNKIDNIKKKIREGKLKIKYFNSEKSNLKGELDNVPLFAVAIEAKTVKRLIDLWVNRRNKELAINPIQFQMLAEVLTQSVIFADYALEHNQPEIAKKYKEIQKIITEILEEKKTQGMKPSMDHSFLDLMYKLELSNEDIEKMRQEYNIGYNI